MKGLIGANLKNNITKYTFILILFWMFLISGCSKDATRNNYDNVRGYSVIDATGVNLVFKEKPKRIVSLSISVDEILLDMVNPDRIVALTNLADDPGISSVAEKAKAVKQRVRVKNMEQLLMLEPDLVIVPDWIGIELAQNLRGIGIPVYVYKTPVTIAEIQKSIHEIAKVVHEEKNGEIIVATMQKRLAALEYKLRDIPDNKRQTVVALSLMGAFGGKGTTFDDICKHAHVINGVSETGIDKNESITKEQIVAIDPDIFLMPTWDFDNKGDAERLIQATKNDSSYQTVKAIRNNKLIQIHDAALYSISHYVVDAAEEIAQAAYPDNFK
ncbi:MAG: ABC transporter substrate-binding protein [Negativicutes bacterium]|nr:ABC transporter substrate-binding protein [Negativicutes bacterium]